jgi:CRP-like cAMP-binding protein
MTSKNPGIEALKHIALFSACSDRELALIVGATTPLRFEAGAVLAQEGKQGHEFMVIVEGKARVEAGGNTLATLGQGDFFGEVALLDGGPRTASVVAETDVLVEVIGQREFDGVVEGAPHLAKKLLIGLARRLRDADIQLTR